MSITDMLTGQAVHVVGVEPDPIQPDLLRVYVGARWKNLYVLVGDPDDQVRVRRAWDTGGRVTMAAPPADRLYEARGERYAFA